MICKGSMSRIYPLTDVITMGSMGGEGGGDISDARSGVCLHTLGDHSKWVISVACTHDLYSSIERRQSVRKAAVPK
jgi:hypothetical protein